MRRAPALLAVLVLAGCGGGGASKVVEQTAQNLRDIRSGVLHVKLLVDPHGSNARPFGFELNGAFSLGRGGAPPLARLTYAQIASGKQGNASLVLGRDSGSVTSNGTTHELTQQELRTLRAAASAAGAQTGDFLPVQEWVMHAKLHSCGANQCVEGGLDAVKATNDLLSLGRSLGRDLPVLSDADEEQLRDAVRSGTFELVTGKTDRLLRRLSIRLELGLHVPRQLATALGSIVGATFTLDFAVERPNATTVSG